MSACDMEWLTVPGVCQLTSCGKYLPCINVTTCGNKLVLGTDVVTILALESSHWQCTCHSQYVVAKCTVTALLTTNSIIDHVH